MIIYTDGLDVEIEDNDVCLNLIITNESEKIDLNFSMDEQGLTHTYEQIISELFNYNDELAHKLYQEYGNVPDLLETIQELKDRITELESE